MATALVIGLATVVWNPLQTNGCKPKAVQGFQADFASNGINQYTSFHHKSQMQIVADPTASGRSVLSMTARSTDIGVTSNPRVQMAIPNYPLVKCTEFWASLSVYIPKLSERDAGAMAEAAGHVLIAQIYGPPFAGPAPLRIGWNHDPSTGSPVFGVGAVTNDRGSLRTVDLWRTPLRTDRWLTVAIHMLMSPDPDQGYVQVWADMGEHKGLIARTLHNGERTYHYATMNAANYSKSDPVGSTMYLDSYWPARADVESVSILFRDNALGNSLDEVTPENIN